MRPPWQHGSISVALTEARKEELFLSASMARGFGVPVEELSPAEVKERYQHLNTDGVKAGVWLPTDGQGESSLAFPQRVLGFLARRDVAADRNILAGFTVRSRHRNDAGVLWLASGGAWQKKVDLYRAIEDESVAGLNLNAPVKYNGVDVGKVRAIELDHANPNRVNLLFAIERGTPIREDTIAVLKTQGLTGIAYVELSGGAAD